MNSKILYFVSGLVIGAISGAFGYKLYNDHKVSKFQKEALDTYDDLLEGYQRTEVNPDEERTDEERTNTGREKGVISQSEREAIKEKLVRNQQQTTNYAEMYNGNSASADVPDEGSDEEEELDSDEIEEMEAALDATFEHQKNKNKKPKIISYEAIAELPTYVEQSNLFYYMGDGVLANEEEEELTDAETFVGDALHKYGFADEDNDETEIYVMNYALDTCYTVTKVQGSFKDLKV